MNNPESSLQPSSLWQFVPLSEYQRPAAPAGDSFRLGFRYLWSKLRQSRNQNAQAQDSKFKSLPPEWLDRVAPPVSWNDGVIALGNSLDERGFGKSDHSSVQLIVGPAGSGSYEVASQWAQRQGYSKIPTPTVDQVLGNSVTWVDQCFTSAETPQVLLRLERYYLRHYNGLNLVRRLMESLESAQTSCLVQCDSWAWAYLSNVLDLGSSLLEPLVLKALDHEQLQQWFQDIAPSLLQQPVRQVGNDRLVLDFGNGEKSTNGNNDDELAASNFLRFLAGYSRGIPLVAREIWRNALRVRAEEAASLEDQALWVPPWPGLELPRMPSDMTQCDLLLLHTVLIHGGLESQVIPKLIPFSSHDILQSLQQLRRAGLLEDKHGTWQVTLTGYPSVRQHLSNEGFLVDSF